MFASVKVTLRCNVKNLKGFFSDAYTTFPLAMKSSSTASAALSSFTLDHVNSEATTLQATSQIQAMAQQLGSLKTPDPNLFAPKLTPDQCNEAMCSFNGQCVYLAFSKQYYCVCSDDWSGRNCSFKNSTQLEQLQNLTLETAKLYNTYAGGDNDLTFLQTASSSIDLMTPDLFDVLTPLIQGQINTVTSGEATDTDAHQNYLQICSSLLEYTQFQQIQMTPEVH